MKWTLYAATAMVVVAAASSAVHADTSLHRDAARFVEQQKIGKNLPVIALSVAMRTVTFAVIASKLGNAQAIQAVSDQINALLPRYQPEWDERIAQAYEKSFTAQELSSLASEGLSSKYASTVLIRQSLIGQRMESAAKPILNALVAEALNATLKAER